MRRWVYLITCLVALGGCATSPLGRQQLIFMPDSQVNALGISAFDQLKQKTPLSSDSRENQYILCVAQAVANEVGGTWEIAVFRDPQANAFALPGGKIGVYTGILEVARTPAQLAAVLAHEIGHVLARHSNERISQQYATEQGLGVVSAALAGGLGGATGQNLAGLLGIGAQYGLLLPWGRTQESEADLIGLQLMARAGFDPRESVALWRNMAARSGSQRPPEFLSTHPSEVNRVRALETNMPGALELYAAAQAQGKRPQCGR